MKTIIDHDKIKVKSIVGRYVTNDSILNFLSKLNETFTVETIGFSVEQRPIKSVTFGSGPNRIFMWSQMHGNESTTTKAVIDLINYIATDETMAVYFTKNCTLKIIPILSPDGAEAYTRINANQVDLNRDAQNLSQPESIVLRNIFDDFKPHFAFNLHGQRTIYNVGNTNKIATVSFLSPSIDESRKLTETRKTAMQLIVAMNEMLQEQIPESVGRYDDGFNLNCVGDTFQSLNCPTVLFEAGHYSDDYDREVVRKLIFNALCAAISTINENTLSKYNYESYFKIPENGKQFFDILIKNIHNYDTKMKTGEDVGLLFEEVLANGQIKFVPKIEQIGVLNHFFGHKIYDCAIKSDLIALRSNDEICSLLSKHLI